MPIIWGLAAMSALLAAFFWVRVALSRSLRDVATLDGTEPLFERLNRRALTSAVIASLATILLAAVAYLVR